LHILHLFIYLFIFSTFCCYLWPKFNTHDTTPNYTPLNPSQNLLLWGKKISQISFNTTLLLLLQNGHFKDIDLKGLGVRTMGKGKENMNFPIWKIIFY